MEEAAIIEQLTLFGLSRQEAAIYLCLLKNEELTGYEVAKLTGISRSNVYNGLASLVEHFPGERSACYSADLLLRQYKRVRGIKGKRFSYRDIKQVYTIVLFEKSPTEFQKFSNNYIHRFMQKSDTGVNINLLQEYLFIPLDIFKKNQQNENRSVKIENRLEAWLAFFCMDDPETIIDIIEKYPDFKEMYEQAYDVCRNIEEVMQMFSKELLELDRNTVKLMIDDMQKEIDCQREQLSQKDEEMLEMRKEIQRLQQLLDKK